MPLISVIVPCYNQAQYLDECLQSVLDQTYQDWECIIVNDGSPDNTEEVAQKWLAKDSRFKYLYKENGGLSSARNAGIKEAKGEWILPLDADDRISKNYLKLARKEFEKGYAVIYGKAERFGVVNDEWLLKEFSLRNLARQNVIYCSSFYRKCVWENVGGYDENMKSGLEDWEFWIKILKDGGRVIRIEEVVFFYRIKESSMLSDLNAKKTEFDYVFKYVEQKHIDFFQVYLPSYHLLYSELAKLEKKHDQINNRFFNKVVNKIYSLLET